jgi:peroxiredoxin
MTGRFSEEPADLLDVGATAPDFTLRRTFEESVSLAELLGRGPVVLAFYVFDFGNV